MLLLVPVLLLPAVLGPLLLQLGGVTMLSVSSMTLNLSSLSALVVVVRDGEAFTCSNFGLSG